MTKYFPTQLEIIQSEHSPSIQKRDERLFNPRQCCVCESYETGEAKGYGRGGISYYERWFFIGSDLLCNRCYNKIKYYTDDIEYNRQRTKGKRRVVYNGKRIMLPYNPRTGKCSWCGKEGRTRVYTIPNDFDPMLGAVEVCLGCYTKTKALVLTT